MTLPLYRRLLPKLDDNNHVQTSKFDPSYNCIGYAAGTKKWWQPGPMLGGRLYWPNNVPREESLEAYMKAFETIGYVQCLHGKPEEGYEKIALYGRDGKCTHAARQLEGDTWTSKLGKAEDISHRLNDLEGSVPQYGVVMRFMKRPLPRK